MKFLLLVLILSACTIPGFNLNTKNKQIANQYSLTENELNDKVIIFPLTSKLISDVNNFHRNDENKNFPQNNQKKSNYQYLIGAGDVLTIKVYNQKDLQNYNSQSDGFVVDNQGQIFYPLIGNITVKNKTLNQVRALLNQKLNIYFKNFQLDVSIAQYKSKNVSVNGEVKNPGNIYLNNIPLTLLDAINNSGGITKNADATRVIYNHRGVKYQFSLYEIIKSGDLSKNIILENGDIIYIPPKNEFKVYIAGEAVKQKVINLDADMNLLEAFNLAEGINQVYANPTGIFVIRNEEKISPNKPIHIFQLDLRDASALVFATNFKLKANDIVFISASPVTRWNRLISQILPTLSGTLGIKNAF